MGKIFRENRKRFYIVLVVVILVILSLVVYFWGKNIVPNLSPDESCISSAEKCDNIDNDCDGDVDGEVLGNYTCGVGACKRSNLLCIRGVVRQCVPGEPGLEKCGDRVDNDCDGGIDELGCS